MGDKDSPGHMCLIIILKFKTLMLRNPRSNRFFLNSGQEQQQCRQNQLDGHLTHSREMNITAENIEQCPNGYDADHFYDQVKKYQKKLCAHFIKITILIFGGSAYF